MGERLLDDEAAWSSIVNCSKQACFSLSTSFELLGPFYIFFLDLVSLSFTFTIHHNAFVAIKKINLHSAFLHMTNHHDCCAVHDLSIVELSGS